ncbi:MAG: hypothetical protein JW984_13395 [Deltaproteobacteria bacterium]|uniref:DUF4198 domain-containing protein n=1 Tax=Candidatus Zymogenus saltonus TaxID=2844893 RepID=A0A9D8PNP2_9DELT|nr:hypothetical protein [Candidatus Zymogenus saltonus]
MKKTRLKKSVAAAVAALAISALFLLPSMAQIKDISMWLEKTTFSPGERIVLHFKAPASFPTSAWIGIIPSNIPHGSEATNDQNDIEYKYLQGMTSGTLYFTAPRIAGTYDFRMHDSDNNGSEVGSMPFYVVSSSGGGVSLSIDKRSYRPGEQIRVTFTAPATYPSNAWIGIIPSNIPHGSEATNDQHDVAYQYLKGMTSGTLYFTAPGNPGSYDMRMHDSDSNGTEVSSVSFNVSY